MTAELPRSPGSVYVAWTRTLPDELIVGACAGHVAFIPVPLVAHYAVGDARLAVCGVCDEKLLSGRYEWYQIIEGDGRMVGLLYIGSSDDH